MPELDPSDLYTTDEALARATVRDGVAFAATLTADVLKDTDILGVQNGRQVVVDRNTFMKGGAGDFDRLILRPENFGGRALSYLTNYQTYTATSIETVGSGLNAKMRLIIPGGVPSGAFSDGDEIRVQGAQNAINNGLALPVENVTSTYIEVVNSNAVEETGSTITVDGFRVGIADQDYNYNAAGVFGQGSPFDNYQAMTDLVGALVGTREIGGKPFGASVMLSAGAYPTSPGINLGGVDNTVFLAPGRSQAGFLQIDGTSFTDEKPHLFYVQSALNKDVETADRISWINCFVVGSAQSHSDSVVYGDGGRTGRGDLYHVAQKKADDADQRSGSSKYRSVLGGPDPRHQILNCHFTNGSRHNIFNAQRGDSMRYFNTISSAQGCGLVLEEFDGKQGYNIFSACGENAVRVTQGSNDIKIVGDLYYFNGNLKGGFEPSNPSQTQIEYHAATVAIGGTNVKLINCRLEDTAACPFFLFDKVTNTQIINTEVNNAGSQGPSGSGRDFISANLDVGGENGDSWFGESGVPLISMDDNPVDLNTCTFDIFWRGSRSIQAVSHIMDMKVSQSGSIFDNVDVHIKTGSHPNAADRARVDQPEYGVDGAAGVQLWTGDMIRIEDHPNNYQKIRDMRVFKNGVRSAQFEGRLRTALFEDQCDGNDTCLAFSTNDPVRGTAAAFEVLSDDRMRVDTTAAAGRRWDAVTISGADNAGNNGTFPIYQVDNGTDIIVYNPDAVDEPSPSGSPLVVIGSGGSIVSGENKPAGRTRTYTAVAIGENVDGDKGSVTITGLTDGAGSPTTAILDTTGQEIVTRVNYLGQETVVSDTENP